MKNTHDDQVAELSDRIRRLIDRYDSQADFGRLTSIDRSVVSGIARGKIRNLSFQLLNRIVDGTGCDAEWLITGNGQPFPKVAAEAAPTFPKTKSVPGQDQTHSVKALQGALHGAEQPEKDREFLLLLRQLIDNYLS